jgi:hypothetical protein
MARKKVAELLGKEAELNNVQKLDPKLEQLLDKSFIIRDLLRRGSTDENIVQQLVGIGVDIDIDTYVEFKKEPLMSLIYKTKLNL